MQRRVFVPVCVLLRRVVAGQNTPNIAHVAGRVALQIKSPGSNPLRICYVRLGRPQWRGKRRTSFREQRRLTIYRNLILY